MSAWKEWQLAMKNGDMEQAELSRRMYEDECRREAAMDREIDDMMDYGDEDDDEEDY